MINKVVITGIGVLSPIAIGREHYWESLKQGKQCFRKITLFDTSNFDVDIGGLITDFDAEPFLGKKGLRTLDRSTKLVCSAAKLALEDSNLEIREENEHSVGVSIGATFGSLHSISQFDRDALMDGPRYVNPSLFPNTVINSPASNIAIRFGIKGFNTTVSTGFCASLDSIIYASDFLRLNRIDTVLAGGVEELCEETYMMFHELGFLAHSDNGVPIICPYDARRNGFMLSEGAAVLILETEKYAFDRNARVFAKVSGYGSAFEPSNESYFGTGEGIKKAILQAIDSASMTTQDIDSIFSSANSTQELDRAEAKVFSEIFRDSIPISAIKSMIGETFSASGSMALSAAVGTLNMEFIPPTLNYSARDPKCNLNNIHNSLQENIVNNVLVTASDIYGNNSAIILSKY